MAANPQATHILPAWYDFIRRHVVLSLLIICEIVTNGGLVLLLVVHNVNDPWSWSWLEWVYAATLPLGIGLVSGGIAVSLSQICADAFNQRKWGTFLFMFAILLFYGGIEVWASLVERSATSKPTPADLLAFQWLNMQPTALTVSACVFAFMLPFSAIFIGFANRPKQLEDDETWEQKARRRVAEAKLKAELATITSGTAAHVVGGFWRQAKAAAKGEQTPDIAPAQSMDNASANLAPLPVQTLDIGDAAEQVASGAKLPKGPWNSKALLAYIALEYPMVSLSETQALETIKTLGDGRKKGTAYVATIGQCKAWALRTYGEPSSARSLHLVG